MSDRRNLALMLLLLCLGTVVTGQECPERNTEVVEEGRTCRKSCTRDDQCKGALKRCRCDDVCGMSCFNPEAECREPDGIENGRFTGRRIYGESITYTCNDGFILEGPRRRSCRSDRRWTGSSPTCVGGCPLPPRILNNAFSNPTKEEFRVDDQVEYQCKFGFDISGNPHLSCQNDGTWSRPLFVCVRRRCRDPGNPRNGYRVGDNFDFGSIVRFHCNTGYQLVEIQNFMTCTTRGEWHGRLPTCSVIECPAPVAPSHGSVDSRGVDYIYGNEIRYSCEFGYAIDGDPVGRCNENSTWGEVPKCILDRGCDFGNGRHPTCTYSIDGDGWVRMLTNNDPRGHTGYLLRSFFQPSNTFSSITRLTSARFPAQTRFCLKFYYLLSAINNGGDFSLQLLRPGGARETLWRSYTDDARNAWLDTDVNLPTMTQSYQIEFVARKPRGGSTTVDLDDVSVTSQDECDDGCGPRPCQRGGACLNRITGFKCFCLTGYYGERCQNEVRCNVPASLPFRSISSDESSVRFDRSVTYTCEDGYHIEGENSPKVTVTCRVSARNREVGQWSRDNPRCVEIRCRLPTRPPEVLLSSSTSRTIFRRREQVSYECRRGFIMADQPTGMLTVTCRSNGTWTDNVPTCYDDAYKCTKSGQLCHFPFRYDGRSYSSCTTAGAFETELWCALDARYRSDRWGYCATCPSRWSLWGEWGDCSATCRSGISTRRRTCTRSEGGSPFCVGNSIQTRSCSTESCSNVEISVGNKLYAFFHNTANYDSARRRCELYGGDLARSRNRETNRRLTEAIQGLPSAPPRHLRTLYYIGLTDRDAEGRWRWQDGEIASWSNWGRREPYGGRGENCVAMIRSDGLWIDLSCNGIAGRPVYFICEKGILSSWSSWSECTRNCPGDGGQQTRSRSCDGLPSDSVYCRKSQTTRRDCETSAPCTYEEIELRGRIYSFVVEARNYTSARRNCQNMGGDLATIKTAALQTRLLEKMAMINTPALPDFSYIITFYLGMTGPDKYNWRWIDGTAVPLRNSGSYQSWGNAQPNDGLRGTEDCAAIYKGSGEWHDIRCDLRLYSICERELDPCRSGPCLNGGTCHRNGRSYLCECPNLVSGTRCQDVENLCWSSPCMNEGSCSGDAESYTCQCRERWTGSNCDVGLSLCNFNETALSPGVFVVGSSGSRSYSEGETITVGCSKPGAVLRARTNMTKCSRRIWRPDYRRFTCINGI